MDTGRKISAKHNYYAAAIVVVSTVFRIWYSGQHELLQDEAYYWQWSRHLAVGYYDNTPLLAFIIRGCTSLVGSNEIGVRLGAVICSAGAGWFIYKLASEIGGSIVGLAALVVATVNPFFGAGAFLMTQDPVQVCFWSICAWVTWHALHANPTSGRAWGLWIASGALAGLTIMSKLNGLLILPSVFLYCLLEPDARIWIRKPQPYIAAVLALAIFAPFVWWNHTHGNAFWTHIHAMGTRTDGLPNKITLKYTGEFLGAQAGLISPLLFLTYLWALFATPRRKDTTPGMRYCWALSVVVFVATLIVSLRSRVEGNWAIAAYATGLILVSCSIVNAWQSKSVRVWHIASVGLAAILTFLLIGSTIWLHGPRLALIDKRTDELYGWQDMAARVNREERATGGNPFVFGINYRMPSEMAFYLHGQPHTYSLFLHDRASQYMFWENAKDLIGRNAIMVNDTKTPDHLNDCCAVFNRVEVEPPLEIYRAPYKGPIRTIQIFRCYGFKGYRREDWQVGW